GLSDTRPRPLSPGGRGTEQPHPRGERRRGGLSALGTRTPHVGARPCRASAVAISLRRRGPAGACLGHARGLGHSWLRLESRQQPLTLAGLDAPLRCGARRVPRLRDPRAALETSPGVGRLSFAARPFCLGAVLRKAGRGQGGLLPARLVSASTPRAEGFDFTTTESTTTYARSERRCRNTAASWTVDFADWPFSVRAVLRKRAGGSHPAWRAQARRGEGKDALAPPFLVSRS